MKYGTIEWEVKEFEYRPIRYKDKESLSASLKAAIRQLWASEIDYESFLDLYNEAIRKGLYDASIEGALEMGFNPLELTPFDTTWVEREIWGQSMFVPALALFILANNKFKGGELAKLYNRVPLWTSGYDRVLSTAKAKYGTNQKLIWLRGGTKKPCVTCLTLNGVVALASDWDSYNHKPQSFSLACHGFNCRCGLYATNKPLSRGGIPFV